MARLNYESPMAVILRLRYTDVIKTSGTEGEGGQSPDLDIGGKDDGWSGFH